MKCPYCSSTNTNVLDSRPTEQDNSVRRRRECTACHARFTTYERVEYEPILVIKKDGSREAYSREKLLNGLFMATKKCPVSAEELDHFAARIERALRDEGRREITATELGQMVLTGLKKIDPVAYIRFASVYREFDSIDSFRAILAEFEEERNGNSD
ncbi:MAG: transcriptional repressor NrdR [Candidatus Hydrogenedentota bacterium]|nr:MAG: transcriptional repressor NrdR [Candidatus Hydrogenedentota bacterium]